jgi:hypothetical protein
LLRTIANLFADKTGGDAKDVAAQAAKHLGGADNLIAFTKTTRVEPIALVDQRLMGRESTTQVLSAMSALFTAYYMQAVALLVSVKRINTLRLLDQVNPQRDISTAAGAYLSDYVQNVSKESFRHGLPMGRSVQASFESAPSTLMQSQIQKKTNEVDKAKVVKESALVGMNRDANAALSETANLSVGRMVDVEIEDGNGKAKFPVMIRLIVSIMAPTILTHILGDGSRNTGAKEMFHDWRSKGGGFTAFWRDIVMAQDLIDEHRRALMKDDSGTYAEILKRRATNSNTAALTATPSINNAANLIVISSQTAKELERLIGARLDDFNARQRVFKSSYVMIMAVVDTEWDRVTFYHRDIKLPTQLSVKELKVSNKGTGPDVGEILKAYQLGNSPSI